MRLISNGLPKRKKLFFAHEKGVDFRSKKYFGDEGGKFLRVEMTTFSKFSWQYLRRSGVLLAITTA